MEAQTRLVRLTGFEHHTTDSDTHAQIERDDDLLHLTIESGRIAVLTMTPLEARAFGKAVLELAGASDIRFTAPWEGNGQTAR